jgi:hypothetical protein
MSVLEGVNRPKIFPLFEILISRNSKNIEVVKTRALSIINSL